MAKRTVAYQLMPWLGGRNANLDPAIVPTNQLVLADNTLFSQDMARRKRPGLLYFDASAIGSSVKIMAGIDYWANVANVKTQREVVVTNEPGIYSFTPGGVRTALTLKSGSAALVGGFEQVSMEVMNEDLIIAFDNTTTPKKWDNQTGTEYEDLGGTPPNFSFCRKHINRLFAAGVAANKDRLYYSSTDNHEEWNGAGDSGAIDIFPGDGDPEGLTGIFPTTKGALFVAKRNKLYRVNTSDPDDANWTVDEVSVGIGVICHNAICAVGQDDIMFVSDRGIHSLVATDKFGDFENSYLSKDIQKDFNTWSKSEYKRMSMAYVPYLSSIVLATAPEDNADNINVHLFNVDDKQWYRWPSLSCEALWVAKLSNGDSLMIGNASGRVNKLTNDSYNDNGSAITFNVKTGTHYPDNSPNTIKGFKKLSLFYKPKNGSTITARFKIDNYQEQELEFDVSGNFDALGTEFVLGSSILGLNQVLPALTLPVDGYGRGFSLELIQDAVDEEVEVYGFAVEYEQAGDRQETPEQLE